MSNLNRDHEGRPINQFGTPIGPPHALPSVTDPWGPPAAPPGSLLPTVVAPPVGRRQQYILVGAVVVALALVIGSGVLVVPRALHVVRSARSRSQTPTASGPDGARGTPGTPAPPSAPGALSAPTALTAPPPPGADSVVTISMAHEVVEAMWPLREQAMYARDNAALSRIETGTALAGDRIRTFCGCMAPGTPRGYTAYETFVTKQTSYPARFLAEVETDQAGPTLVDYMGLVRDSAGSPWRVELETFVTDSGPRPLNISPSPVGEEPVVSRSEQKLVDKTFARLAAYWQQAKDTGRVPPRRWFEPGAWTTEWVAQSSQSPNGRVEDGTVSHIHYRTVPGAPKFVVTVDDGVTMACEGLSRSGTLDAAGGPVHQGTARREWGATLPPGDYRSLHAAGYQESCIFLPPHSKGTGVVVIGGDVVDETSYSGVLAGSGSA